MQVNLGEKIKELRKRDGRTQEELANALSVTNQAVSRWEANGGFPDITLIPSIANYFHVTIDELFGYNGDREQRINDILVKADSNLNSDSDNEDIISFLRDAAIEFPSNADILFRLGNALALQITYKGRLKVDFNGEFAEFDIENNLKEELLTEAIEIFERLLTLESATQSQKAAAVVNLVPFYTAIGQEQKALKLANAQVGIDSCKEFLLMLAATGKERSIITGSVMIGFLRYLKFNAILAIGNKTSFRSSQKGVDILISIINVYKTVIDDGNLGVMHSDISDLYIGCTNIADRMGAIAKAKEFFDLAFYHKSEYDKLKSKHSFKYTSALFDGIEFPCNILPENTMGPLKALCAKFSDDLKNAVKNDERYNSSNWWD